MSKIAFFCIPAHGHTNPTLAVVKELVDRGHEVWYYSFEIMREKIEATGARYISCDGYDTQMDVTPDEAAARIGTDLAFAMELLVNTTLAMDEAILGEMRAWEPDCIVADSMAVWGKLVALKLGVPFVSSTTTFAFNRYSAQIMKRGIGDLLGMLWSMPKANKPLKRLRKKGYPVKGALSIIQNDEDTHTIVYTSPEFQPCSETFSEKYTFVGPSIRPLGYPVEKPEKTTIYISLGTVNTHNRSFFKNCIACLKNMDIQGVISLGEWIAVEDLGEIPGHIRVAGSVNQMEVLQQADLFLTHCGMNSVNEALYYEVPLLMFPQTPEQQGVANRVFQLGAGMFLEENSPEAMEKAIREISGNAAYRESAKHIACGFRKCKGAEQAADKILAVARR